INSKLLSIPITYTKVITEGVKKDPAVINLASGDSEFQTPKPAIDYCLRILPDPGENCDGINTPVGKWTHYASGRGSRRLREAIAGKYKRESGIDADADCVLITNGGMNAIYTALCAMLEPGDEVLIPDPSYIAYEPIANYVLPGVHGKRVLLSEADDYALTPSILEKSKTAKTKAVILTSPLNPTGDVYNRDRLQALMEWAQINDVFILHDENHEKEVYDDTVHIPVRVFDKHGTHSVCVNSFSRLGMGGWRLGWILGPPRLIEAAKLAHTYINMSCNTFVQETGAYV
ncbi:MAG: aminotransferase class I/II-fold pyridoxal phosphate-dependent enzyme, partial [Planctomycetes bacterium]|nr:aminotransferase class I/II-fold pyridoxal phosphate-dependent enzyme [Planctomycetota bacterium]